MLAALGVVFLYIGSIVQVMDITMAVVASLCCAFAVIEYGGSYPWLIYAVTGVASLIVLPQKEAAVIYILFFGFYPILKKTLEKRRKLTAWMLKELIFNVSLAVMLILSSLLLTADSAEPLPVFLLFVIIAEITFPIYDIALTRLISFYIFKLRKRLRIK